MMLGGGRDEKDERDEKRNGKNGTDRRNVGGHGQTKYA